MLRVSFACLFVIVTTSQAADPSPLDGTWNVTRAERTGKGLLADELKTMQVVFKDGKMAIKVDGGSQEAGFKLDPKANPATIDMMPEPDDDKKISRGIYKLDGDTLTICWGSVGNDRPKDFTPPANGSLRLMVLSKAK